MPTSPTNALAEVESLASLLQSTAAAEAARNTGALYVPTESIRPNPHQPRRDFDSDRLQELADSIAEKGVLEPLVVRKLPDETYELVAGERRWRAACKTKLSHVPVILREYDDTGIAAEDALIENIQREDLCPADEVRAVEELIKRRGGVQAAAKILSKPVAWISKRHQLAQAPDFIQTFLTQGHSDDRDGLYELAQLAKNDPELAQQVVAEYQPNTSLRAAVREIRDPQPQEPAPVPVVHGESSFRLGSTADTDQDQDDDGDVDKLTERAHTASKVESKKTTTTQPMRLQGARASRGLLFLDTPDGTLRLQVSKPKLKELQKAIDTLSK